MSVSKFKFKGKKLLFLLVLLSYMVPFELIAINLAIIADELSELNELYEHEHPYYYKGGEEE